MLATVDPASICDEGHADALPEMHCQDKVQTSRSTLKDFKLGWTAEHALDMHSEELILSATSAQYFEAWLWCRMLRDGSWTPESHSVRTLTCVCVCVGRWVVGGGGGGGGQYLQSLGNLERIELPWHTLHRLVQGIWVTRRPHSKLSPELCHSLHPNPASTCPCMPNSTYQKEYRANQT